MTRRAKRSRVDWAGSKINPGSLGKFISVSIAGPIVGVVEILRGDLGLGVFALILGLVSIALSWTFLRRLKRYR